MSEAHFGVPLAGNVLVAINIRYILSSFNDAEATEIAFRGGWFHGGDLAVVHPDGYIELRDRAIAEEGESIKPSFRLK